MRRWICGAAVGGVILFGIGCGGGGDDTTTVTITKAEFVKQADAICKRTFSKRVEELKAYDQKQKSSAEKQTSLTYLQKKLIKVLVPSMRTQLKELEALGVPESSEAKVERLLASFSTGIDEVEEQGLLGLRNNEVLEDFNREAEKLGIECTAY